MDKYLSKQEVKVILEGAPKGSDPGKIVDGLVSKGFKLEGFNDQQEQAGETGLKGVGTGIAKGVLSTVKGAGQLGAKIGQKALGAVGIDVPNVYSEESLQANAAKGGAMGKLLNEQNLKAQTTAESIGKGAEQIAEFAIPGTKVSKLSSTAPLAKKIATRALGSGTTAAVQSGDVGIESGIAGATEAVFPIAGKVLQPAKQIVSRLFKGLAGGLSGTPTKLIDTLVENPQLAKQSIKELEAQGANKVLERNARQILTGVSGIKQKARRAFGEGLNQLSATDINPKVFREGTQEVLERYGSTLEDGKRILNNVEFDDPKNIQKASNLIDKLANAELDGKSLRKLADDIENAAYKTATSDERLAYNAFVKDLSETLKKSISNSTSKLDEINKAFSTDMQLVEAVEDIFGKVDYRNMSEVLKASQKLENLFTQKGLAPEIIDSFLEKIGAGTNNFRTSEAVRQISEKTTGSNVKGLNFGEVLQQFTASIVTPTMVRDAAILTGKSEPVLKNLLENTAPTARAALIKALIGED